MLNIKKLFDLFCEYYHCITGTELSIKYNTSARYFNRNMAFSFRKPRTDVCNICYASEQDGTVGIEVEIHKRKFEANKRFKKTVLDNSGDRDTLVVEFDYAQNLPLPRLPVNDQFYMRLLWYFIFNAHLHGSPANKSYMFTFLEGCSKKGANSVCSFLNTVFCNDLTAGTKTVFLLSDACPGQNRNYTVSKFLSATAVLKKIEILQLFPVRGHSYCQCDRNFGLYAKKIKSLQSIKTPPGIP